MPINAPQDRAQLAGMPSQWSESVLGSHAHLYADDTPNKVIVDLPLALSQTLPAYSPVMRNGAGNLVAAVQGTPAIGITLRDHVVGASGELPGTGVVIQACLNIDAIAWPASYTTDAHKFGAFAGAATPTNIVLKRVYRGSVVAQP